MSSQGFKQTIYMGALQYTSTSTSGIYTQVPVYNYGSNAVAYFAATFVAPRAGSITALSAYQLSAAANNRGLTIYKNGSSLVAAFTSIANGANSVSYAKNTYTFAANDYIQILVTQSDTNSSTVQLSKVEMEIEVGA